MAHILTNDLIKDVCITYIWVQNRMVVLKVSYCTCVQLDLSKSLFDCLIKPLVYCLTGILSRTKFWLQASYGSNTACWSLLSNLDHNRVLIQSYMGRQSCWRGSRTVVPCLIIGDIWESSTRMDERGHSLQHKHVSYILWKGIPCYQTAPLMVLILV